MAYRVEAVEIEKNRNSEYTNEDLARAIEDKCNQLNDLGYEVVTVQLKPFSNQDKPNTAFVVAKGRD